MRYKILKGFIIGVAILSLAVDASATSRDDAYRPDRNLPYTNNTTTDTSFRDPYYRVDTIGDYSSYFTPNTVDADRWWDYNEDEETCQNYGEYRKEYRRLEEKQSKRKFLIWGASALCLIGAELFGSMGEINHALQQKEIEKRELELKKDILENGSPEDIENVLFG